MAGSLSEPREFEVWNGHKPRLRAGATPERKALVVDDAAREKLVKIEAKVVAHSRYVTFQMADVAVPRRLFGFILRRISQLGSLSPVGHEQGVVRWNKNDARPDGEVCSNSCELP